MGLSWQMRVLRSGTWVRSTKVTRKLQLSGPTIQCPLSAEYTILKLLFCLNQRKGTFIHRGWKMSLKSQPSFLSISLFPLFLFAP